MGVPFLDLKAQYAGIKSEIDTAIAGIVESCQFVGGSAVKEFESNFASYVGARHGVGASSGTSAIHLALVGLGIGPGDEVITACNTFIATTEAITHSGATPVLVDIDPATHLIDTTRIEAAITPKTTAIMPVHLYGQPVDMSEIRAIAEKHSLIVIADACQAHGAMINGDRGAILGDATCYSFYPGKNLGAYGDAGAVVTDNEDLANLMRSLADHGSKKKYHHFAEGWNYRLDGIQAAVLDVKLKYIEQWTEMRRTRAALYDAAFADSDVTPVASASGRHHVYHLYVVRVNDRDAMGPALWDRGIGSGIHYPMPLHQQEAYKHLELGEGSFPVAEAEIPKIISLPIFPEMTDEMVAEVVAAVKELN